MKAPLPQRIKALEDANMQLIEKINRMKAQVRHNTKVLDKLKARLPGGPTPPTAPVPQPKTREQIRQEQNDALAAWFAAKKRK